MSKRQSRINAYWYNVYRTAMRYLGIELRDIKTPTTASLKYARKEYKKAKKDVIDLPSVRELYKIEVAIEEEQASYEQTPRDETTNRTDTAQNMYDAPLDVIQSFKDQVRKVFWDTNSLGSAANMRVEGLDELAALTGRHITEVHDSAQRLLNFIDTMIIDSNNNLDYVAEAIRRNGELDYTIATVLQPPSDIEILFDFTLDHLQKIWDEITEEVRQQAEQNME